MEKSQEKTEKSSETVLRFPLYIYWYIYPTLLMRYLVILKRSSSDLNSAFSFCIGCRNKLVCL